MASVSVFVFVCCVAVVAATPAPIVSLKDGQVQGKWAVNGSSEFLNIPFATPPMGKLRWMSPKPAEPWTGVRDGTQWGNPCMQAPESYFKQPSEDCLNLNVFVPPGVDFSNPGDALPVAVFIYGGSWKDGADSIPIYDGSAMAGSHQVVVVTINYRVGVFGFAASELLRQHNAADNSTGNFGIQDQRLAIQWVHDNIAVFGGNSSQVFVWGESAGAGSTSNHLVMPRSAGLFTAAGMESGPEADWIAQTLETGEAVWQQHFLEPSGCNVAGKPVECMLALNSSALMALETRVYDTVDWRPTIDGVELTTHPVNLAMAGKFVNRVPVLLGSNKDEGTLFNPFHNDGSFTWAMFNATAKQKFGAMAPHVIDAYPPSAYPNAWWAFSAVIGESAFNCPTRRTARWLQAAGLTSYVYYFTHLPSKPIGSKCVGVCHGSELPFVFNDGYEFSNAGERQLADRMDAYWANFAINHVPSADGAPAWPAFDTDRDDYLQLDTTIDVITGLKAARCDLWDEILKLNPLP